VFDWENLIFVFYGAQQDGTSKNCHKDQGSTVWDSGGDVTIVQVFMCWQFVIVWSSQAAGDEINSFVI
jgi:hypothetical protein